MQAADECVSHILVPEGGRDGRDNVAKNIVKVLEDSGSVVDEKLRRMCSEEGDRRDVRKKQQLCHSLKATGICQ